MKKIFSLLAVFLLLFFSFFSFFIENSFAEETTNIECTGENCLNSPDFKVNVTGITPGGTSLAGTDSKETVNSLLGQIIQLLLIAMGVLALAMMTYGSALMIIHAGDEERLTSGKTYFMGGIIALALALSSYFLVDFVRFILFR